MPTPAHTRVTWSGTLGPALSPVEIFQFGLNLKPILAAPTTEVLQDLADAMQGCWTAIQASMLGTVHLTRTRVAQIGPDGTVNQSEGGAYRQADNLVTALGGGTGGSMPLQVALCVSLETDRAGASGKGRFYLPAPAITIDSDFRIPTMLMGGHATRAAAFINAVNNAWATTVDATEGPRGVVVASSKGYLSEVVGVRVGRVPDTQRSRRGALLEEYTRAPVAA